MSQRSLTTRGEFARRSVQLVSPAWTATKSITSSCLVHQDCRECTARISFYVPAKLMTVRRAVREQAPSWRVCTQTGSRSEERRVGKECRCRRPREGREKKHGRRHARANV